VVGEGGRGGKQQRQGKESDAGRHWRAILHKRNRRASLQLRFSIVDARPGRDVYSQGAA